MFNFQKYRDYVDEIHAPEALKRAALQKMRQGPERRRIHPLIPAAAMACACTLLLAVVIPWSAGRSDGPEVSDPGAFLPLSDGISVFIPALPPLGEEYQPEILWNGGELLFQECSMDGYLQDAEIPENTASSSLTSNLGWIPLPTRLPEDLFPAVSYLGDTLLYRSADEKRVFVLHAGAQDSYDAGYLEKLSISGKQLLSRVGDMFLWLTHDGSGESEIFGVEFAWNGVGCTAYSAGLSQREFLEAIFSAFPSDVFSQEPAGGELVYGETDALPFPGLETDMIPLKNLSGDWRGALYPRLVPASEHLPAAPRASVSSNEQIFLFTWENKESPDGPRLLLAQTRQSGFADGIEGLPLSAVGGAEVMVGRSSDALFALFQTDGLYCLLRGEGLGQETFETVLRSLLPVAAERDGAAADSPAQAVFRVNRFGTLDTQMPHFNLPDIDRSEDLDYDSACKLLFGFDPAAPAVLPEGCSLEKPDVVALCYQDGALLDMANGVSLHISGENGKRAVIHAAPSQIPYWSLPRDEAFARAMLLSSQDPVGQLGEKSVVEGVSFTLWEGSGETWDWYGGGRSTVQADGYLCADFIYLDAGFSVAAEGFTREEFAALLLSLTHADQPEAYLFSEADESKTAVPVDGEQVASAAADVT